MSFDGRWSGMGTRADVRVGAVGILVQQIVGNAASCTGFRESREIGGHRSHPCAVQPARSIFHSVGRGVGINPRSNARIILGISYRPSRHETGRAVRLGLLLFKREWALEDGKGWRPSEQKVSTRRVGAVLLLLPSEIVTPLTIDDLFLFTVPGRCRSGASAGDLGLGVGAAASSAGTIRFRVLSDIVANLGCDIDRNAEC
ncbi:hypothetical protein AURDEDRAFT_126805 [Auricularia subglabra TFB-10046 SS5]|nr:hypothetical protein AURDEDRAFT_126805 [Auricularia subglabra TFB-10046 SS5]